MWRAEWFWLLVSRLIVAFATLANIGLATRLLGASEYGLMGLLLTFHSLFALLLISPAGQHITRQLNHWWSEGSLMSRMPSYALYSFAVAVGSACLLMVYFVASGLSQPLALALLLMMLILATTWYATLVPALNLLGWSKLSAALQSVAAVGSLFFSWLLGQVSSTAFSWITGQILGLAVTAVIANLFLMRRITEKEASPLTDKLGFMDKEALLGFSFPLSLTAGMMWLQWNGWRFIVERIYGVQALGAILAGYLLASYMWVVIEGLSQQMLHPVFFRRLTVGVDEARMAYGDFVNILGPIYLVATGFMLMGTIVVSHIVPGTGFELAKDCFIFGVMIESCRVIAGLFSHAIQVTGQARTMYTPYYLGLVVSAIGLVVAQYLSTNLMAVVIAILMGALLLAVVMGYRMTGSVPFKADRLRWGGGFLVALFGLVCATVLPLELSLVKAIFWSLIILISATGVVAIMLRRNPAMTRMVAMKLELS
jgi:O-antigen/teichoic acid export membrane protein